MIEFLNKEIEFNKKHKFYSLAEFCRNVLNFYNKKEIDFLDVLDHNLKHDPNGYFSETIKKIKNKFIELKNK